MVIWGGDAKAQRIYATTSSASANTSSPLRTVSNIANCTSGAGNSNIQPSATPLTRVLAKGTNGGLGVGTATIAYADLKFDAAVPLNTIVFAKITAVSLPTSASTVTGVALNNGVPAAGTAFYNIVAGDGSQYVAVYATVAFNQIRINVTAAGSGLLNVTPEETASVDIQYAYYNANGSSAPVDCGLAIGTSKSGNGAVDNMQQAIDGNLNTYSTITPAALLSSVNQHFYFSALSNTTDEIKVTLSVPAMALSLGLANTITVSAYNGSNPTAVWTQTLGTLLSLDLLTLLGNGTPVTTSIKPGVSFDRLTINSAAVLSVLFSLRVHEVQITAASPALTVPNPTICANTSTTLAVTAPALSTAKWYDAAAGGNLVGSGNSFTTPILTTTTTYYVAIAKIGCTEESVRVPALVTVLPAPTITPILGTLTACVGKTTSLSSLTTGGSWSSATPAVATIDAVTGIVTGQTAGTSIITYTVTGANNCSTSTTAIVTINALPAVNAITGTLSACIGNTTQLASTTPGGVWTSGSTGIATVNSSGLVTGVAQGTSVITYTVTNGNGCVASQTATVTINPLPVVNAITGTLSACIGNTTQLASTTPGGVWTSGSTGIATVNSSGLVTGVAQGTSVITYTVTNGNGCVASQTATVTINPLPVVNAITGTLSACIGNTTQLASTTPGGVWTSSSTGIATVNSSGLVTGVAQGTSVITYTVTNGNGCVATQTAIITINPLPVVTAITGTLNACIGQSTQLSSTPAGGVWTSSSTGIATVNSSGLVTGVAQGTSVITYTVTNGNGCVAFKTATVTINPLPVVNAITGTMSTCIGKTTQLANATGSGIWSSATAAVASVNSSGLVTGITAGTATINYTVTNGNGCITMVTASVVIHLQPALPAIAQKNLCLGQAVDLNTLNPNDGNGTTGGTYSWSAISAGGTPLSSTTVSPALGNTTYYLRYTKDGCFSDSSVLIIMHPKPPTPHVILN